MKIYLERIQHGWAVGAHLWRDRGTPGAYEWNAEVEGGRRYLIVEWGQQYPIPTVGTAEERLYQAIFGDEKSWVWTRRWPYRHRDHALVFDALVTLNMWRLAVGSADGAGLELGIGPVHIQLTWGKAQDILTEVELGAA